jgi:hypothetical protein
MASLIFNDTDQFKNLIGFSKKSKQKFKELIFDLFVEYSLLCSNFEEFSKFLTIIFNSITDNISNFWSDNFHQNISKVISHVNSLGISQFGQNIWNDSYILKHYPKISLLNIFVEPMGYILLSNEIENSIFSFEMNIKLLFKQW